MDPLTVNPGPGLSPPRWGLPRAALRSFGAGVLAAAAVLVAAPACAQSEAQSEYRVKAAFLYKFGSYVEWPERTFPKPDSALTIGVMGADALADELAQIVSGRSVNGRPVQVRRLRPTDAVAGLHMLFVGRGDDGRLAEIFAAAKGHSVLTVTESENALRLGSVINFVVVDDKVRFDVALAPADLGSLKISSRLLAVARKVVSRPS